MTTSLRERTERLIHDLHDAKFHASVISGMLTDRDPSAGNREAIRKIGRVGRNDFGDGYVVFEGRGSVRELQRRYQLPRTRVSFALKIAHALRLGEKFIVAPTRTMPYLPDELPMYEER